MAALALVLAASGCHWFRGSLPPGGGNNPGNPPRNPPGDPGNPGTSEPLPTNGCSPGACDAPKVVEPTMIDCPTGSCDPENPNGQGIYTVEEGNYCFLAIEDQRFCPESFVNVPEGVALEFRDRARPLVIRRRTLLARFQDAPGSPLQDVKLLGIRADRSQLTFEYSFSDGKTHTATGADLNKFTFGINSLETGGAANLRFSYEMKLSPDPKEKSDKGVYRYEVRYRDVSTGPEDWVWHCQGKGAKDASSVVSFLPQARVSGLSAYVSKDPKVVTMACETGAIATCMNWGYAPWDAQTGQFDDNRDYVFRSCLQAKRAAYFVGKGDNKSYTLNGTKIALRDQYGIKSEKVAHLEAIWSPEGAVCINKENLRQGKAVWGETPPDTRGVGPCGTPPEWSVPGKLATGPTVLPR
jgi:hypothetical protein